MIIEFLKLIEICCYILRAVGSGGCDVISRASDLRQTEDGVVWDERVVGVHKRYSELSEQRAGAPPRR